MKNGIIHRPYLGFGGSEQTPRPYNSTGRHLVFSSSTMTCSEAERPTFPKIELNDLIQPRIRPLQLNSWICPYIDSLTLLYLTSHSGQLSLAILPGGDQTVCPVHRRKRLTTLADSAGRTV